MRRKGSAMCVCLLSGLCVLLGPVRVGVRRPGFYQDATPPPARGAGCSPAQHICVHSLALGVLSKRKWSLSESVLNACCRELQVMFFLFSALCCPAASLHVCAYISYFRRCVTSKPHLSPESKTQARFVEAKTHPLSFRPHPGSHLSTPYSYGFGLTEMYSQLIYWSNPALKCNILSLCNFSVCSLILVCFLWKHPTEN